MRHLSITSNLRFAFVSVHEQTIPGGAEHATHLRYGKGVGVLAHCGDTQEKRDKGWKEALVDATPREGTNFNLNVSSFGGKEMQ